MVRVWSVLVRIISPWLMLLVHAVPVKTMLFQRAKGLVSVSAIIVAPC